MFFFQVVSTSCRSAVISEGDREVEGHSGGVGGTRQRWGAGNVRYPGFWQHIIISAAEIEYRWSMNFPTVDSGSMLRVPTIGLWDTLTDGRGVLGPGNPFATKSPLRKVKCLVTLI